MVDMKLGFIGLGKMGLPMVKRLVAAGHEVVVYDLNQEAAAQATSYGATAAKTTEALMAQLGQPAIVWLMIPAQVVDQQLGELLPHLPKGSVIIDGGNSDYRLTLKRSQQAQAAGVTLVDVGTSGGVLGGNRGYCMMVGGEDAVVTKLAPLFEALAEPQGWQHVGPSGAGHYVKMVHNAIEYGLMESYAEGYHMLKEGPFENLDLGRIGGLWQHGSIIDSLLNDLIKEALTENPSLEGIEGSVAESGEARWTLEEAAQHHIALPAIQAALDVRLQSQKGQTNFATKLLAAMRNKFGGHALNKK